MKKTNFIFFILVLLSLSLALNSCNRNQELDNQSSSELSLKTNNVSILKSVDVSVGAKNNYKLLSEDGNNYSDSVIKEARLNFEHNDKNISIETALTNNGNYIFDLNSDGNVDLQIEPIKRDYSEVYYLDGQGKKISKAKIEFEKNRAYINIIEVYNTDSKINQQGKYGEFTKRKGKWRTCFETVAGSAEGIIGAVACNFGGPWCLAGYYSGIALGCLVA